MLAIIIIVFVSDNSLPPEKFLDVPLFTTLTYRWTDYSRGWVASEYSAGGGSFLYIKQAKTPSGLKAIYLDIRKKLFWGTPHLSLQKNGFLQNIMKVKCNTNVVSVRYRPIGENKQQDKMTTAQIFIPTIMYSIPTLC